MLYVCDRCHAIANTASGNYYSREEEGAHNEALCPFCCEEIEDTEEQKGTLSYREMNAQVRGVTIASVDYLKKYGEHVLTTQGMKNLLAGMKPKIHRESLVENPFSL